jgi:hypothetical protein
MKGSFSKGRSQHVGEAAVSGLHRVGVTKSDPSLHLSSGDTWLIVLAAA